MTCDCGHEQIDHEWVEEWGQDYFFACEIPDCPCVKYQKGELWQIKL
jgi:hypothetical protein